MKHAVKISSVHSTCSGAATCASVTTAELSPSTLPSALTLDKKSAIHSSGLFLWIDVKFLKVLKPPSRAQWSVIRSNGRSRYAANRLNIPSTKAAPRAPAKLYCSSSLPSPVHDGRTQQALICSRHRPWCEPTLLKLRIPSIRDHSFK